MFAQPLGQGRKVVELFLTVVSRRISAIIEIIVDRWFLVRWLD